MNLKKIRSPSAVCFGIACIIGTLIVLFGHVRSIADLTISHLYISLALIVAFGAGHFMWEAFDDGLKGIAIGSAFTLLFIMSTIVCVGFSAGRSADLIEQREREAAKDNQHRSALESDHQAAIKRYETLRDSAAEARTKATEALDRVMSQCASGRGTKCDGTKEGATTLEANATLAEAAAHKALTDAILIRDRIDGLSAPTAANGDLKHIARVWAMFSGKTPEEAFSQLKLLLPYALALLTEFGAITFLKHGMGKPQIMPPVPAATHVTLNDLAAELKIDARLARKALRDANEPRGELGWAWPAHDVARVKSLLVAQIAP